MKFYSKSAALIAAVVSVTVLGMLVVSEQTVRGQANEPAESSKVTNGLDNGNDAQDRAVKGVGLTAIFVSPNKEAFLPLEPIVVELSLINNSDQPISLIETASSQDYNLVVKDAEGNLMPPTRFGYRTDPLEVPASDATRRIMLSPGEKKEFQIVVNRMADMTVDGDYSVIVRRSVFVKGQLFNARSNTLRVAIASKVDGVGGKVLLDGEAIEGP